LPQPEQIITALGKVPDRNPTQKGDGLWICCPYHSDGREKTPSLKINLAQNSYPIGSWRCFGCSKSGNWSKLAIKLGLKKKGEEDDEPWAPEFSSSTMSKLLDEEDDTLNSLHEKLLREPIIQKTQNWRGIKGWLLNELGARVSMLSSKGDTIETTRVYLPINVKGKWIGGIFCSWSGDSQLKYENERHESRRVLFPYDYVANQLKELPKKERRICLVEGPRDALNLLQNDILAIANIGGTTVWDSYKAELIQELDLQCLVVATDPDTIGTNLANRIKRELNYSIPRIVRFKMEVEYSESGKVLYKEDPGNLSFERVQYLKSMMKGK